MYTVRQLIIDAFKRSSVRGLGDTPDNEETDDALGMLNDILGILSRKQEFSEGYVTYIVNKPIDRDYITFSDSHKRTFSAVADNDGIVLNFDEPHMLEQGMSIDLRIGGLDFSTTVSSTDTLSVVVPPNNSLNGCYKGSYKMSSEGPEYLIDVIATPPVNMAHVIASGKGELEEVQQQFFYGSNNGDGGWFYEKTRNPYPKLYVKGAERVKVVFPKTVFTNVNLDTDLSSMDDAARAAIKYRLAAEIAGSNGFDEKMKTLLALYKNAYGTFARSVVQSSSPVPDTSAPGYVGGRYNIYTDGGADATF